jgi:hypothetical protein
VAEMTDPRELVRLRVERVLAAEDVNLASHAGRERTEQVIDEVLATYTPRRSTDRHRRSRPTNVPASPASSETTSSASERWPSACSPTPTRRSG